LAAHDADDAGRKTFLAANFCLSRPPETSKKKTSDAWRVTIAHLQVHRRAACPRPGPGPGRKLPEDRPSRRPGRGLERRIRWRAVRAPTARQARQALPPTLRRPGLAPYAENRRITSRNQRRAARPGPRRRRHQEPAGRATGRSPIMNGNSTTFVHDTAETDTLTRAATRRPLEPGGPESQSLASDVPHTVPSESPVGHAAAGPPRPTRDSCASLTTSRPRPVAGGKSLAGHDQPRGAALRRGGLTRPARDGEYFGGRPGSVQKPASRL